MNKTKLVFKIFLKNWLKILLGIFGQFAIYFSLFNIPLNLAHVLNPANLILIAFLPAVIVFYLPLLVIVDKISQKIQADLKSFSQEYEMFLKYLFIFIGSLSTYFIYLWASGNVYPLGWMLSFLLIMLLELIYNKILKKELEDIEKGKVSNYKDAEYYLKKVKENK